MTYPVPAAIPPLHQSTTTSSSPPLHRSSPLVHQAARQPGSQAASSSQVIRSKVISPPLHQSGPKQMPTTSNDKQERSTCALFIACLCLASIAGATGAHGYYRPAIYSNGTPLTPHRAGSLLYNYYTQRRSLRQDFAFRISIFQDSLSDFSVSGLSVLELLILRFRFSVYPPQGYFAGILLVFYAESRFTVR